MKKFLCLLLALFFLAQIPVSVVATYHDNTNSRLYIDYERDKDFFICNKCDEMIVSGKKYRKLRVCQENYYGLTYDDVIFIDENNYLVTDEELLAKLSYVALISECCIYEGYDICQLLVKVANDAGIIEDVGNNLIEKTVSDAIFSNFKGLMSLLNGDVVNYADSYTDMILHFGSNTSLYLTALACLYTQMNNVLQAAQQFEAKFASLELNKRGMTYEDAKEMEALFRENYAQLYACEYYIDLITRVVLHGDTNENVDGMDVFLNTADSISSDALEIGFKELQKELGVPFLDSVMYLNEVIQVAKELNTAMKLEEKYQEFYDNYTPGFLDIESYIVETLEMKKLISNAQTVQSMSSGGICVSSNDFEYVINEDGESITITKYIGKQSKIGIPQYIDGYCVTAIGERAFYDNWKIAFVNIPDSIISVGDYAFERCNSLTKVVIGNGVRTIGANAFYAIPYLTHITIPDSVTNIGDYAFAFCTRLTNVDLGKGITDIGNSAFLSCTYLDNITIPASATNIDRTAFNRCYHLRHLWVDNNNPKYSSDNYGVVFNKTKTELIFAPDGIEGAYTVPSSVTVIDKWAFSECESLSKVTIPDTVENIGQGAFSDCNSLKSVNIPYGVTSLDYTFSQCGSLSQISIPDSVTAMVGTFWECYKLTDITIPNSVTSIGDQTFTDCTSLTDIIIPNSVASIGENAFSGCNNLTSIQFQGDAPIFIKEYEYGGLFHNVDAIAYYPAENSTWTQNVMQNYGGNITWVPYEPGYSFGAVTYRVEKGEAVITGYNGTESEYQIPAMIEGYPVTRIAEEAFQDCESLVEIDIPESVTSIGRFAFAGCYNLTKVTIPKSVSEIGNHAFAYCESLTGVTIPGSVESFGSSVFLRCWSLTEVTILPGVKAIGENAFEKTGVTDVTLYEGLVEIGDGAFYHCRDLKSITVPESVTTIGASAFGKCGITEITIPAGVSNIGEHAFTECFDLCAIYVDDKNVCYSNDSCGVLFNKNKTLLIAAPGGILGNYDIPDSVEKIEEYAFYYCRQLTGFTIGNNLNEIAFGAFRFCTELTSVEIPGCVKIIGDYAFDGCASLKTVTFHGNAPHFGSWPFSDVVLTAYYPAGNTTWTADVMQDYDGTVNWMPYEFRNAGDLDGIAGVDNRDVEYLLWYTLFPEDYVLNQSADYNRDGIIDNKDVEYLLWYTLFPEDYPLY